MSSEPVVVLASRSRSVHSHYFDTDEELEAKGWGTVDLVCHGCGVALRVHFPNVPEETARREPFAPILFSFSHDHRRCVSLLHRFACPPYLVAETRDLRRAIIL